MSREDARELITAITDNPKRLRYYELVNKETSQSKIDDDDAGNPTEQIKTFSDHGLFYRDDDYVHKLSPLGKIFSKEFGELMDKTSELMEMSELYRTLSIEDAEFLDVEVIKGGETFESEFLDHLDRWRDHLQSSYSMKQYAPKRAIPHKGGRSPSHEAIVDGNLEQVKFIHSSHMRDTIEDREEYHKEGAAHDDYDDCKVDYRVDETGEINFNETFAIFDYGSGEKYFVIYIKNDTTTNVPPMGGRLLYEVSTDEAVNWAETMFDEYWNTLEAHSYSDSYEEKWQ